MAIKKTNVTSTHRAIIKDVTKSSIVATGEKFIEVIVDIYEADEKVSELKLGYDIDTTEKAIIRDVKKHIRLKDSKKQRNKKQKEQEDQEKEVDAKIDSLKKLEIK